MFGEQSVDGHYLTVDADFMSRSLTEGLFGGCSLSSDYSSIAIARLIRSVCTP